MKVTLNITVNGKKRAVTTDDDRPLLDLLREDLGLSGTKYGCGEGQCGACSVLIDGKRVLSCVTPASAVAGKSITTIEGLAAEGALHPVQEAFLAESAMQCGYCTSGMILTAAALLARNRDLTEAEIIAGMNRNLCRCNGYPSIIRAIRRATNVMKR